MKPTITNGKHLAENVNIAGSRFHDVNLSGSEFDDINMSKVSFRNINLSDISICGVQMGGAIFRHVGLPPGMKGKQKPLQFDECDLNGSSFKQCDLANVEINNCNIEGLKIDGIPVSDLISEYRQKNC